MTFSDVGFVEFDLTFDVRLLSLDSSGYSYWFEVI